MDNFCSVLKKPADAVAFIKGSEKYNEIYGRVLFYGLSDGVLVRAEIFGLPRGTDGCKNPIYAFHIHSGTECSGTAEDPFASAGSHYNPYGCEHPYHAGDMPPLLETGGKAYLSFLTGRITIGEIIGRTVIIHAHPDDFTTQPSGEAGEKIACGVINKTN